MSSCRSWPSCYVIPFPLILGGFHLSYGPAEHGKVFLHIGTRRETYLKGFSLGKPAWERFSRQTIFLEGVMSPNIGFPFVLD